LIVSYQKIASSWPQRVSHARSSGGGQERGSAEILRKHVERQHRAFLVAPGLGDVEAGTGILMPIIQKYEVRPVDADVLKQLFLDSMTCWS
jgi:hypothetical protein